MREYNCQKCPPYKKHTKIYWVPELKQMFCDAHIELAWKEAKDKKK